MTTSVPSAVSPHRPLDPGIAGRLVSWLAAAIGGVADDARAVAAVESDSDGHVVDNLPGAPVAGSPGFVETALVDAWSSLRSIRPTRIAVVLPSPGVAVPAVGTGSFARAALVEGLGVLLEGADLRLGLVPRVDARGSSYRGVRWTAFPEAPEPVTGVLPATDVPVPAVPRAIEQSERALRRAVRATTEALDGVDLAHWRPELAETGELAESLLRAARDRLPACWPPAARALVERGLGLWRVLDVAAALPGAASASGTGLRDDALRALRRAVSESLMVGYNAPAQPLLGAPVEQRIREFG